MHVNFKLVCNDLRCALDLNKLGHSFEVLLGDTMSSFLALRRLCPCYGLFTYA